MVESHRRYIEYRAQFQMTIEFLLLYTACNGRETYLEEILNLVNSGLLVTRHVDEYERWRASGVKRVGWGFVAEVCWCCGIGEK